LLETEATLEIKDLISDLKPGDGDLLVALHRVQERFGYIPREAIGVVAHQLCLSEARVYGAITFYADFRLTPTPETVISWCGGPACWLRGGARVRDVLEAVLGIRTGESTPDNRVGLHHGQCNGACGCAPMVWVDGRVRGPLSVADAVRLARKLKGETETGS
jgi:formate dehydrogenase subunit gamma